MVIFVDLLVITSLVWVLISSFGGVFVFSGVVLLLLFLYVLPISLHAACSELIVCYDSLLSDSFSFWLSFLVLLVILSSFLSNSNHSHLIGYIFALLLVACYIVFVASDLFQLYVCYEFSLVPILYIIVCGGSYPDRSLSASYMLVYTAIFSFPFIIYVIYSIVELGSMSFILTSSVYWGLSYHIMFIAFMAFLVNLPAYGVHFWLPMAHVEAPTYGSMILAGLLLNLGGCGLLRLASFIVYSPLMSVWASYIIVSLVFSSIVCCVQSDFNRLVAYSSVAHMMVVVIMAVISTNLSLQSFTIIILTHGLTSPILFILVGISYRLYGSRMLVLYRSLLNIHPLLSIFFVVCFVISVPVPPSLAFFAEVQFVFSAVSMFYLFLFGVFFFVFLGVLYNLLWLGSIFGSSDHYSISVFDASVTVREFMVLWSFIIYSLLLLILLF